MKLVVLSLPVLAFVYASIVLPLGYCLLFGRWVNNDWWLLDLCFAYWGVQMRRLVYDYLGRTVSIVICMFLRGIQEDRQRWLRRGEGLKVCRKVGGLCVGYGRANDISRLYNFGNELSIGEFNVAKARVLRGKWILVIADLAIRGNEVCSLVSLVVVVWGSGVVAWLSHVL